MFFIDAMYNTVTRCVTSCIAVSLNQNSIISVRIFLSTRTHSINGELLKDQGIYIHYFAKRLGRHRHKCMPLKQVTTPSALLDWPPPAPRLPKNNRFVKVYRKRSDEEENEK